MNKATKIHSEPHLIQLLGQKPVVKEEEPPLECKYGVWCAHLRANGACRLPHRKNHYLLLNLIPAECAIEDGDEEALSKRERKEKKVIQKTISENIDVQALMQREEERKRSVAAEARKELLERMDEKEKRLFELTSSTSAEEFFEKLNTMRASQNVYEVKRRSLVQMKRKNEKLYGEIIDKEYRIANRLIKQSLKQPKNTLLQVYTDINHNTLAPVRDYFQHYFSQQSGIPQEEGAQTIHLSTLLRHLFPRESDFKSQYCLVTGSNMGEIKANIEFYNLMVPYLHSQASQFNKYLQLDCEQGFSLTNFSQALSKDYAATFHIKCKPFPEYPFGQLQANIKAFTQWASKIGSKYRQGSKESNIVLILSSPTHLFPNEAAQQFEQEKLKERRLTFRAVMKILQPVVYFLCESASKQVRQAVSELLELSSEGTCKFSRKLQVLEQ